MSDLSETDVESDIGEIIRNYHYQKFKTFNYTTANQLDQGFCGREELFLVFTDFGNTRANP